MHQAERMELLNRMAEKDRQIGMVLESKFESRAVETQSGPTPNMGGILPPNQLMDVLTIEDDADFVEAVRQ